MYSLDKISEGVADHRLISFNVNIRKPLRPRIIIDSRDIQNIDILQRIERKALFTSPQLFRRR
jgi:hypothetical protein